MSSAEDERILKRDLQNGTSYTGDFDGFLPDGLGKYVWLDGTHYEGGWVKGKITGKGRICWASGAIYDGDVCGGFFHGSGTFLGLDGSTYRGSWRMNTQHGQGSKSFSNSDYYDGYWKEGLQEGIGSYTWINGNIYFGSWKAGKMNGRGYMKWDNGDIYDGLWLDGMQHGSGYYKSSDGSYYFGTWSRGLKDGRGTFFPAASKSLLEVECREPLENAYWSINSEEIRQSPCCAKRSLDMCNVTKVFRHSRRISHRNTSLDASCNFTGSLSQDISSMLRSYSSKGHHVHQIEDHDDLLFYEREYMQGILILEKVRTQDSGITDKWWHVMQSMQKGAGQRIYQGQKSYYLMLNLQLGIRYTVGKITPVPMREVRSSDFGPRARISMYFPKNGSQFTPPHCSIDFIWKDYCPMVFRNLREMFKIDAADYMMSICGGESLKEISSPGKSGSIFYLSQDERFVIKTLRKFELQSLLQMLPQYYCHVGAHDNTLITKFFGLHRITIKHGKKIRFVVMGNMFRTELRIHRRYDLKGSSQGRSTGKHNITDNTTLKDLDLSYVFHLEKSWRESLFRQVSLDCKFLESQCVIDYSMLLGLHLRAPEHLKALETENTLLQSAIPTSFESDTTSPGEVVFPPKGLLLVAHEPGSVNTTPGSHIRGSKLRASAAGDEEVDLLLPGTGRLPVQLGVNMPARATSRILHTETPETAELDVFEAYDVVLYLGIIDILQEYSVTKRVEHAYKSLKFDPLSISSVEPKVYSRRFISFLEKVFPEEVCES